jgi:DNA repair protein RadC
MNYNAALIQLPLMRETNGLQVRTPADAHRICGDIANLAQEVLQVLCLDAKNGLINRHLVSLGLVDASLAHSREVFRPAIEAGASAIVLVHNLCGTPHKLCYVE